MGDCYNATLAVKFKRGGEKKCIKAVNDYIKATDGNGTNFSLSAYEKIGATPDTFKGIARIFLADWKTSPEFFNAEETKKTGFATYSNCFDCSYGWGGVLYKFSEIIAPFLADGSEFSVSSDETNFELSVENGEYTINDTPDWADTEFAYNARITAFHDAIFAALHNDVERNLIAVYTSEAEENEDGEWIANIEMTFKHQPTDKQMKSIVECAKQEFGSFVDPVIEHKDNNVCTVIFNAEILI